ncbi:MAG: TetR/AcrR family transcriptional regulator [Stackebrandtia sp.]
MGSTSAQRGRETRARLLDAAARLIAEQGWGSVTTRGVAEVAAVPAGAVHYHFGSVSDLLVDAALDTARREYEMALGLFGQAPDVATGLDGLLAAVRSYTPDHQSTVVLSEAMLAAARHERLRVELGALVRQWRTAVSQWLDSHDVADAEATATLLGAVVDGLVLHCLLDPEVRDLPMSQPLRRMAGVA